MFRFRFLTILAQISLSGVAFAGTPTVDGTVNDVAYGSDITSQTVQTQFGDASGTAVDSNTNGSELDNMRVTDDINNVYFSFGGNVQVNGNGIALFIDTDNNSATGATTLPTDGFNEFNGYKMPGNMGVELAYFFNSGSPGQTIYLNGHLYSSAGASTDVQFFGSQAGSSGNPTTGVIVGTLNSVTTTYTVALNNANTAGVTGGSGLDTPANAAAVTTGAEFAVPKSVLKQANGGNSPTIGTQIKVVAVIVGGGNPRFASNQVLPALPTATGYGNLGAPADLSSGTGLTYSMVSVPVTMSAYSLE